MNDLQTEVGRMADEACELVKSLTGEVLDFSVASLAVADQTLEAVAARREGLSEDKLTKFTQRFGCYFLEVARRDMGGSYRWFAERSQPMLMVGEPDKQAGILGWDCVRDRIAGQLVEDLPAHYAAMKAAVRAG